MKARLTVLLLLVCGPALAANPATGIHAMAYSPSAPYLATSPANTQTSGSTILIWIGNGALSLLTNAPSDNMGNHYTSCGAASYAPEWPTSGEALYVCTNVAGGMGHVFYWTNGGLIESTMLVVEVKNGGEVYNLMSNVVTSISATQTSLYATNNAPASIVAFWSGDASQTTPMTATPNSGFNLLDLEAYSSGYVQGASASEDLSSAGTNNVAWTTSPGQRAWLWIAAVQSSSASSTNSPYATINAGQVNVQNLILK